MLDLRFVANRAFAVPAVVEAAAFLGMASIMFIQTQLVQLVLGYSPLIAGLLSLPVVVALIALTGPIATLANRLPVRVMIAGGLALSAVGAGMIALWPSSVWVIAGGMVVVMLGVRASLTTVAIEVIDALPPGRAGIGSALNDTFQEVGGALGVGLLGALLNQAYRAALPAGAPAAVQASIVGAITDPAWIAPARAAFTHGASVALTCGVVILLLVGVVAATLHHPGLRTGLATAGAAVPEDAEVVGPTRAALG
jgi:MFS transporter, DHA2 family, multidrug resistance protein